MPNLRPRNRQDSIDYDLFVSATDTENDFSGFDEEDLDSSDEMLEFNIDTSDSGSSGSDWEPTERSSDGDQSDSDRNTAAAGPSTSGVPNNGWTKDDDYPRVTAFKGPSGVMHLDLDEDSTPKQIMDCFMTEDILDKIVDETNLRASQPQRPRLVDRIRYPQPARRPHQPKWTDTCKSEIRAFFALIVLMGIVHKPNLRSYWDSDPMTDTPFFYQTMTRNRFEGLLTYLHFVNKEEEVEGDRLKKIRPLLDIIVNNCQTVFIPHQLITIDESLFKFKGRLSFKIYCPSKRGRYGFKVYKLCASDGQAAGYTWNWSVYTGEDHDDAQPNVLASTKVVMTLIEKLLKKGHTVVMDNWFSSPGLFKMLQDNDTNAYGTVRLNRRGMPKDLGTKKDKKSLGRTKKMKKGDIDFRTKNGMLAMVWKDKKEVKMLSTVHTPEMVDTGKKDRNNEPIMKPKIVLDYNNGMGGVDRSDQLAASYRSVRKTIKWYKKFFLYIHDMCLVNSFVVWKELNPGFTDTFLDFRMAWIRETLGECLPAVPETRGRGRSFPLPSPLRLSGRDHWPAVHPATEKKANPCKQCVVCATHKIRKESRYQCELCKVSLCVAECFKKYHTKTVY